MNFVSISSPPSFDLFPVERGEKRRGEFSSLQCPTTRPLANLLHLLPVDLLQEFPQPGSARREISPTS